MAAVETLEHIGGSDVIATLQAGQPASAAVRAAVNQALRRLTGQGGDALAGMVSLTADGGELSLPRKG